VKGQDKYGKKKNDDQCFRDQQRFFPKPSSFFRRGASLLGNEEENYLSHDKEHENIENGNPQPGRGGNNLGDRLCWNIEE